MPNREEIRDAWLWDIQVEEFYVATFKIEFGGTISQSARFFPTKQEAIREIGLFKKVEGASIQFPEAKDGAPPNPHRHPRLQQLSQEQVREEVIRVKMEITHDLEEYGLKFPNPTEKTLGRVFDKG